MNDRSAELLYILQAAFGQVNVESVLITSEWGTDSYYFKVGVRIEGYHAEATHYDFGLAVNELFKNIRKSGKINDIFVP